MKRLVYNGVTIGEAEDRHDIWRDFTEYARSVVIHLMPKEFYEVNGSHQAHMIQQKFYEVTGLTHDNIVDGVVDKWEDVIYIEPRKAA